MGAPHRAKADHTNGFPRDGRGTTRKGRGRGPCRVIAWHLHWHHRCPAARWGILIFSDEAVEVTGVGLRPGRNTAFAQLRSSSPAQNYALVRARGSSGARSPHFMYAEVSSPISPVGARPMSRPSSSSRHPAPT
jgi:hypothetical protein